MKYRRIYRLLVLAGHSPNKAGEILLDAVRGQPHAISWVTLMFKLRLRG